jgi:hypothetical protein
MEDQPIARRPTDMHNLSGILSATHLFSGPKTSKTSLLLESEKLKFLVIRLPSSLLPDKVV